MSNLKVKIVTLPPMRVICFNGFGPSPEGLAYDKVKEWLKASGMWEDGKPRRFFGSARNGEDWGSLTIIATALVDTGSRMDEVIFQEFKGTGNTEIVLDRGLFERRIFPAINIGQTGTRKEEKLIPPEKLAKIHTLRRALAGTDPLNAMRMLLEKMQKFPTNDAFLSSF